MSRKTSHGRFRGNFKNRGHHHQPSGQVRIKTGPVVIEFPDYAGEKVCDLTDEMKAFLTNPSEQLVDSTSEAEVGISEYLSPCLEGFDGIIKHRFSDFIVNEIDLNGKIVRITSLDVPPVTTPQESEEMMSTSSNEYPPHASLDEEVKTVISPLTWTRLVQLAKKYEDSTKVSENETVRIDVTNQSKEQRKNLHGIIKTVFKNLMSQTEDGPTDASGKKLIVVRYHKNQSDNRSREKQEWLTNRGKFLHFILHKIDADSQNVFSQLGRHLFADKSKNSSRFKIAGLKDRRGKTSQNVSVSWVTAERLKTAVRKLQNNKIFVGNFVYKKEGLELGDLRGNHFTIAIRNIDAKLKDEITKAVSCLQTEGFINYFGLQRFGTVPSIKTSDIGLRLIKSQWREAIDLILKPRPNDDCRVARVRAFWWMYRNPKDALKMLDESKGQAFIEYNLLKGLAESNENDFVGALGHLSKNSHLLYLHAYQSLVWNRAVSKRIAEFGKEVLVGDLVLKSDDDSLKFINEEVSTSNGDETLAVENENVSNEEVPPQKKFELLEDQLITVTEENLNQFTIYDVVMPIPGWRVRVPSNAHLQKMYDDILKSDGLEQGFESFKHKIDFYSLPGTYRRIIVRPWNFSWRFASYSSPNEDIIQSDLDILRNYTLPDSDKSDGQVSEALIIEMSLPSSAYATMALREAMRRDTRKSAHSKLTNKVNENFASKRNLADSVDDVSDEKKPKIDVVDASS